MQDNTILFSRTLKVGTRKICGRAVPVYLKVLVAEKSDQCDGTFRELSISGVEGPMRNGDAHGACGQIRDALDAELTPGEGWTRVMLDELRATWDRWHLNGMRAGAPDQQEHVRANRKELDANRDWYAGVCASLDAAGLLESCHEGLITVLGRGTLDAKGYCYGHGWVIEELPESVVDFLRTLPESPDRPAWV